MFRLLLTALLLVGLTACSGSDSDDGGSSGGDDAENNLAIPDLKITCGSNECIQ